jgi:hypothetical protein
MIEGEGRTAAALCEVKVEGEQAATAARAAFGVRFFLIIFGLRFGGGGDEGRVTPSTSAFGWWSGGTDELNYHTTLKRVKLAKCNILQNRWNRHEPIPTIVKSLKILMETFETIEMLAFFDG